MIDVLEEAAEWIFFETVEETAVREKKKRKDNLDFRCIYDRGNYIVRHDEITVHKYRNYSRLRTRVRRGSRTCPSPRRCCTTRKIQDTWSREIRDLHDGHTPSMKYPRCISFPQSPAACALRNTHLVICILAEENRARLRRHGNTHAEIYVWTLCTLDKHLR